MVMNMLINAINAEGFAIISTLCLWGWCRWQTRLIAAPQTRELLKRQNWLVSSSFAPLTMLELGSFFIEQNVTQAVYPVLSALILLRFVLAHAKLRNSFWSKKRNVFLGALALGAMAMAAPVFVSDALVIPWVTSLWIAEVTIRYIAKLFRESLRDLDALHHKVAKLEAEQHNQRILMETRQLDPRLQAIDGRSAEIRKQANS